MKKDIAWHQDCLKNMKSFLEQEKLKLKSLQENISRLENDIAFRELQINSAIKQKKDGFDLDLFLKKDKTTEYIKSWSKL